ncbi:MAG TPA: SRPBCC family protein [Vicinamibacterales bacterium]|nr:SRPBCC family protein [Vicinamibacterales bacterium]
MASIRKEIAVEAAADRVWAAIRDVGSIHLRLARDFVVDTRLEGDGRIVTFANGAVIRERIVDIDDGSRRLAYTVVEWRATHHHATFQVFAEGARRSRVVWIADLLPDDLAADVDGMMEQGSAAIKRTLESAAAST